MEQKQIQFRISTELKTKFKVMAAKNKESIKNILITAIKKYIKNAE